MTYFRHTYDNHKPDLANLLLKVLARSSDLEPFSELVEPLEAHDRSNRTDLLRTLQAYLDEGANATKAADRLFLHRNSMLYRLARIEKLTGLDLKDPQARFAIQLGMLYIGEKRRSLSDTDKYQQPDTGHDYRGGKGKGGRQGKHQGE